MSTAPGPVDQKLALIVDDVADNRALLDRALTASGYATMLAGGGREALAMIAQRVPDIVLLDWVMPDLSGLDTLRAIRETHPSSRLPIIMCTALGEDMSVVTALSAGANDYMIKPISLPILRARMATHLEQRALIAKLGAAVPTSGRKPAEPVRTMLGQKPPAIDGPWMRRQEG